MLLKSLLIVTLALAPQSGEEIRKWIDDLGSSEVQTRRDAAYRLHQLGPAAAPAIEALTGALSDRDRQVWFHAIGALTRLGPEARAAIPKLLEGLEDSSRQVRFRSAHALGAIGAGAVKPIVEKLDHRDRGRRESWRRQAACQAIEIIGPAAREAIPALAILAHEGGEDDARPAFRALAGIGAPSLEALGKLLDHEEVLRRRLAARSIARIARENEAAASLLLPRLDDPDSEIRTQAILALRHADLEVEKATGILIRALSDAEVAPRQAAVHAFSGLPAEQVVPALIAQLEAHRDDAVIVNSVADVLGEFRHEARPAIPILIELIIQGRVKEPGSRVARALGEIGTASIEPVFEVLKARKLEPATTDVFVEALENVGPVGAPAIARGLESDASAVQAAAARALSALGLAARPHLGELVRCASSESAAVRSAAARALGRLGQPTPTVSRALIGLLEDASEAVRGQAILALSRLGLEKERLVPALLGAVKDPSPEVRLPAIQALTLVGEEAVGALEALIGALGEEREDLQVASCQVLRGLGEKAAPAAPALVERLESSSSEVRLAALEALEELGDLPEKSLPPITRQLAHEQEPIRRAATRVLARQGPRASSALEPIREAFSDSRGELRVAQARAIVSLMESREKRLEFLLEALEDRESPVRRAVMEMLGEIGPAAQAAVPVLFDKMGDEYERRAAYEALRRIEPTDVEILRKACQHRSRFIRGFAVSRLGNLEWKAEAALEDVRRLTRDGDGRVRQRARQALEAIEKSLEKRRGQQS